jgi:pimeloyl-ACP methyl ester carboxylesterase
MTDAARSTSARVTVGASTLEVLRIDPSQPRGRTVLVFLHEGLGCVELWRDFPARIVEATGLSAIVYSRAGYGRSSSVERPRPVAYMHHEALVVLPNLLDQLGVDDAFLIGHSDGASIALLHAASGEAKLRGLVLMAPHVFVERISLSGVASARSAALGTDLLERLSRYHDDVDAAFWGWNDVWLDPAFATWDICSSLASISMPVLVIQGEDDDYGTSAQVDAIVSDRPQRRAVLLPNCGHSPMRDHPDSVASLVSDFVTTAT